MLHLHFLTRALALASGLGPLIYGPGEPQCLKAPLLLGSEASGLRSGIVGDACSRKHRLPPFSSEPPPSPREWDTQHGLGDYMLKNYMHIKFKEVDFLGHLPSFPPEGQISKSASYSRGHLVIICNLRLIP